MQNCQRENQEGYAQADLVTIIGDNEFFSRLREVINLEWVNFPNDKSYRGTGGPGLLLEELIGVNRSNRDGPDTGNWELKYHGGTAPITLFHKTPEPKGNMHAIVHEFGWLDKNGRISFRHTIWGTSPRGFRIVNEDDRIVIRNDNTSNFISPYWTHDTLITSFAFKLRRLAIVHGKKRKNQVRYESAHLFWDPSITKFINAIENGIIAIDFDARTTGGEGRALRDHGTKFRIKLKDLESLYLNNRQFD